MVVTATQFKSSIGRYLDNVSEDEVYITKNGKFIAKLSSPEHIKLSLLESLAGIIAGNQMSLEEAKRQRLARQ